VQHCPPQLLGADFLPCGGLHEWRARCTPRGGGCCGQPNCRELGAASYSRAVVEEACSGMPSCSGRSCSTVALLRCTAHKMLMHVSAPHAQRWPSMFLSSGCHCSCPRSTSSMLNWAPRVPYRRVLTTRSRPQGQRTACDAQAVARARAAEPRTQEDGPVVAHDHALVRHGRDVGPPRGAGAQHHRDLRDACCRHARLHARMHA
jgi:hypothetical protein